MDLRLKETVEVTGTRGVIDSARSPVSSTVVTRDEIEARNVRTVEQVVNATEGVAAYRTRGVADNGAGVGMRGFSGRSSGQSRVLVLLDGQPINDADDRPYWRPPGERKACSQTLFSDPEPTWPAPIHVFTGPKKRGRSKRRR